MLPWRLSKTCFMYRRSQLPYCGFSVVGHVVGGGGEGEGKDTAVIAAASPSGEAQYSPMSRGAVLVSRRLRFRKFRSACGVGAGFREVVAWWGKGMD
ncbi:hypothetical protein PR202_ga23745 [Eleusine coracana subsp. coracana]|uniref:Uncharacterized protein n=1 Tax=Eleusine coracana subsp. coracana TaxID=191504 RepID=A0AAV5D6Z8_ELECO|nr:hypothetical protein PR202_ga23745 [Eleusine coracana subsp. coracana]